MHISWRRRNSISRMLMEQHQLETKFSSPQRRRPTSDRKDRLRASLNAAKGSPAFCGWRFRTRRQRQRSKACNSHGVHSLNSYLMLSGVQPATASIGPSTKTKPAQSFQMRGQLNFQTRSKFQFEQSNLLNKISALTLAGAGGIEPPNGGIKIRCLTAWLRPNRPGRSTGSTSATLPAPPVYRGSHAISTGRGGEFYPKIAPIGTSLYNESLPRLPRGRLSSPGGPNTTQRRVETTPVSWEDGGSH